MGFFTAICDFFPVFFIPFFEGSLPWPGGKFSRQTEAFAPWDAVSWWKIHGKSTGNPPDIQHFQVFQDHFLGENPWNSMDLKKYTSIPKISPNIMPLIRFLKDNDATDISKELISSLQGASAVSSWFIKHIQYTHIYHKDKLLEYCWSYVHQVS